MFDLRYHVASLTAVFLALVIGILVGVGLADRGLFDQAKKSLLERRVTQLQTQLDQASQRSALSDREQKAAAAKPALYASRFNTMFSIGMLYCMVAQQNMPI